MCGWVGVNAREYRCSTERQGLRRYVCSCSHIHCQLWHKRRYVCSCSHVHMSTLAYTCQSKSCITGHKCVAAHPYTSSVVTGETCVSAPMHTHTDCTITADMCVVAHANQSTVPLLEISASMPKHLRKQGRIAQPLPGLTSELILVQPNQRQTLLELLHAYSLKVKIS